MGMKGSHQRKLSPPTPFEISALMEKCLAIPLGTRKKEGKT